MCEQTPGTFPIMGGGGGEEQQGSVGFWLGQQLGRGRGWVWGLLWGVSPRGAVPGGPPEPRGAGWGLPRLRD